MTGINYQALRPEDIPELQASKHFRKFQHLIRTKAQVIERDEDAAAYEAQLKSEAQEIVDAWEETKNGLRSDLRKAVFEQGVTLSGEALKALIKGCDATDLAIAGGIAMGLLIKEGLRSRENVQRGNPYQYLSEVVEAQDEFLRMTFPLGLEP